MRETGVDTMLAAVNALTGDYRNLMAGFASSIPSGGQPPVEPGGALISRATPSDEVSLSEPGTGLIDDGFYQRTDLSVRSRFRVSQTDDGELRTTLHSKLRFRYDFEAADGTKIRIRAKANLHYSQKSDGDQQSQSLKLRVKAHVSVVQKSVTSGVGAVAELPELSAAAQQGLSEALELFQQMTDAATSVFLGGDPLDGDSLIAGLVEAFNELTGTMDTTAIPAGDLPESLPHDVVEQIAGPVLEQPGYTTSVPAVVGAAEPAVETDDSEISLLEHEAALDSSGESDEVAYIEPVEFEDVEQGTSSEDEAGEGEEIEPTASQQTYASVKMKMRVQFIQSLTRIVGAFDSDSSAITVSQSAFRASFQVAARYNLTGHGETDRLSKGQEMDSHV